MLENRSNEALAEQGFQRIAQMIERLFAAQQAGRADEDQRPGTPAFAAAMGGK